MTNITIKFYYSRRNLRKNIKPLWYKLIKKTKRNSWRKATINILTKQSLTPYKQLKQVHYKNKLKNPNIFYLDFLNLSKKYLNKKHQLNLAIKNFIAKKRSIKFKKIIEKELYLLNIQQQKLNVKDKNIILAEQQAAMLKQNIISYFNNKND